MYTVYCILCTVLFTVNCILFTVYCLFFCILDAGYCILYTVYCMPESMLPCALLGNLATCLRKLAGRRRIGIRETKGQSGNVLAAADLIRLH